MICIVQRVSDAHVDVGGEIVGKIARGMLVLAAVERGDSSTEADWMAAKLAGLRIFPNPTDGEKEFDLDLKQIAGQMLLVSNFTVAAATRKGKRPSFDPAAAPADAERIFDDLVRAVRAQGIPVETGRFRAMMQVSLTNDGPATFIVQTDRRPDPS